MGNDCLLVFKLDSEFQGEIFENVLDKDVANKVYTVDALLRHWSKEGEDNLINAMLSMVADDYKLRNPARTAATHDESCCCMRCVADVITGYLEDNTVKR